MCSSCLLLLLLWLSRGDGMWVVMVGGVCVYIEVVVLGSNSYTVALYY